jgi:hypothetical protein
MSGYLNPSYAHSLDAWGEPVFLPRSEGWLLVRSVPNDEASDALGLYPFFACRDWSGLSADIAELRGIVCLSLVTDPFGNYDESLIRQVFPHHCAPFKNHHVVDLRVPRDLAVSKHHCRNAGRALAQMEVSVSSNPSALIDVWCQLYGVLVERHGIRGPQLFSRSIFERQLAVPGINVVLAERDKAPIGMTIWYEQGDVAYYHLGAYSPLGYKLKASFAIFSTALEFFRPRVRWLALGAGAGLEAQEDGLTRFKRGWATSVRPTYLCGAIFNREQYRRLTTGRPSTDYFPAYRAGEFA